MQKKPQHTLAFLKGGHTPGKRVSVKAKHSQKTNAQLKHS